MPTSYPLPDPVKLAHFASGLVIPAHPLALTASGQLDERSQRALTKYYLAAGAGGIAVGVHTTQFEIRDPGVNLLAPVLELAAETVRSTPDHGTTFLIAGVCGDTDQAAGEAQIARDLGYDAGLLSLAALGDAGEARLLEHSRTVASILPIVGFYLQPAVGGRVLSYSFWRQFAEIPNVIGIKVAPFNRYMTQDALRAVSHSERASEIALYTGNDDHIVLDLASSWQFPADGHTSPPRSVHFSGGLLGHWACWTRPAVTHLERCKEARSSGMIDAQLQTLSGEVTESNAALFDVANNFAGCIAGIHYVLHSQGLMQHPRCLNPNEIMSPGQQELIQSIRAEYPHLTDDEWVAEHLDAWRS